ncbi:MAG: hypothetical protein J5626_09005, partial [Lachnospiraceae bacterium]|nr:hypothetical protein [Lachnospiraceae bacterium]
MKKTFKEKAVSKAAGLSKKHKLMKPLIFLVLITVLGVYNVIKYFYGNGKKYVSIGFVFVFFLLCSSFSNADEIKEGEVYLSSMGGINITDDSIPLNEEAGEDMSKYVEILSDESDESYTADEIEPVDSSDMFSLDDFFMDTVLSEDYEDSYENGFSKD